ncbi:phosphoenolpyruvate synthase [Synechococcus sp. CCY9201]|uniref:phosphoenolpyruvate synthase n=1 Tax=unclassified Synechococcus TaxID=2626047 RepID=UPI002AD3A9DB|nr:MULTISPECIES: phosphoenolpyruvate synthase [unclassified Synechococcus]MEA5424099.1 phosphoenolpyruvate synthase [Synechococcus sp. CCY9202]MEA5473353.1 phosphoenolpyruvate synthase [Synechococcus sp. CCY9201]CAK6692052.1 Phosphoenolpyruvate synthase [Synechococcus sp. CBW1107]
MKRSDSLVVPFDQVGIDAIAQVGGKNASLGEMIRQLGPRGVKVPGGFAITAAAYRHVLASNGLTAPLAALLGGLDANDLQALQAAGQAARQLLLAATLPQDLCEAIATAYRALTAGTGRAGVGAAAAAPVAVAVRSSATAEDLPDASFAGQQETYLHIEGEAALLEACRHCYASLFTDRAISYRQLNGFDHLEVALSIGVQRMVRSDLACSGVMFSIDTETGFKDAVLLTAAYGLGENVVQGAVNPDEYLIFKPTLEQGFAPILSKRLGSKAIRMVYGDGDVPVRNVDVPEAERDRFALTDAEVLTLSRWAVVIERHYSEQRGTPTPMDIEWAKDGLSGELFILQARPETVQSHRQEAVLRSWHLTPHDAEQICRGRAIGSSVSSGRARVIRDPSEIDRFEQGDLLVTERTDPDWEPILKRASGVVTDQGGRTCHAAIIAREMGITAIVGTGDGTTRIADGEAITISCCEGDVGHVYRGTLPFHVEEQALGHLPATGTAILMNVGNPEEAFNLAAIPCDGVGLARLEFIIANHIKVHPLALLQPDQVSDPVEQEAIARLTRGYAHPADYYVDLLAQGMGRIAAAFFPRPVILRFSDFKSNEYARLLGGAAFEPVEENPMLGWRGASRYCSPVFREAFALECTALKAVREGMGLTNVIPMIPFCRTPEEGDRVLAEMARSGLVRGEAGLQVYVMCELPSNVIAAEAFAERFDGFSIGSNDLTQLTLGLDRDSALVADLFDERHPAVMAMIRLAIQTARRCGRKIGICGQAPSDYPEFARFLVAEGIDSISLNPDAVIATRIRVAEMERQLEEAAAGALSAEAPS